MTAFVDKLFQILINGGVVLGIFVILLINNKGVKKTRANTFLSILLAALTFSTFHIRYAGDVINHFSLKAYTLGDPTFLLIAPMLWFYTTELTGGRVKMTVRNVLHFVPFFVIIFASLAFASFLRESAITKLFDEYPRLRFIIFWLLLVAQFSSYQYFIHKKWLDYQKVIRQEVSNTEDVTISWIRFFMAVFLVVNVFFFFSLFAAIHLDIMAWIWKLVGIILSLSIFALGYKGILQKEIFYSELAPISESPQLHREKVEPADLFLIDKLQKFMENEKPYLDAELSLSSLAKKIGLNRNQLSQLINEGIGENFYDFVNKYRVEEVKRLMADPEKQNYNLLGVALEAGFKSKSTFNLIFKRFTGLTPTEYRKNIT